MIETSVANQAFRNYYVSRKNLRVLEIGTLQSVPGISTHSKARIQNWSEYILCDMSPGDDVDIVCDAHKLTDQFQKNSFDIVVINSVLEHVRRTWIVAQQIYAILKRNGIVHVQTHQSFPLHGYPDDYYRFSIEALSDIFGPPEGYHILATGYEFPCTISFSDGQSPPIHWDLKDARTNCYLNSVILSMKLKES